MVTPHSFSVRQNNSEPKHEKAQSGPLSLLGAAETVCKYTADIPPSFKLIWQTFLQVCTFGNRGQSKGARTGEVGKGALTHHFKLLDGICFESSL